jgi:hypothetical protein
MAPGRPSIGMVTVVWRRLHQADTIRPYSPNSGEVAFREGSISATSA